MNERFTYKDAGVDVQLADRIIGSLSDRIAQTFRPEVLGKQGGFAALFLPDWSAYENPVLVSTTDGVGTKLKLAFMTGIHTTVGIDLVAMNVNDLLVSGAEPLFFLDYLATGELEEKTIQAVIGGIAAGCSEAGCSLVGGETAEMPDFYQAGEYDLAGFAVGMVDRAKLVDGSTVRPGQVVLGIHSSGLHSNGFSLVRKLLFEQKAYSLDTVVSDLSLPLGEELLRPTRIYVRGIRELIRRAPVNAMAHITGGGFAGNLPRVIPDDCIVRINPQSWEPPPIFGLIQREALLDQAEMFGTFNMGIGFVLIMQEQHVDTALETLHALDLSSTVIGAVHARESGEPQVALQQ